MGGKIGRDVCPCPCEPIFLDDGSLNPKLLKKKTKEEKMNLFKIKNNTRCSYCTLSVGSKDYIAQKEQYSWHNICDKLADIRDYGDESSPGYLNPPEEWVNKFSKQAEAVFDVFHQTPKFKELALEIVSRYNVKEENQQKLMKQRKKTQGIDLLEREGLI